VLDESPLAVTVDFEDTFQRKPIIYCKYVKEAMNSAEIER
jgi:hypothetical protein